jgi:hypothetical protein
MYIQQVVDASVIQHTTVRCYNKKRMIPAQLLITVYHTLLLLHHQYNFCYSICCCVKTSTVSVEPLMVEHARDLLLRAPLGVALFRNHVRYV